MNTNAQLNGHASREQLALEVQAEALRPTPQVHNSLRERLNEALERVRLLRVQIVTLERQKRENRAQFQREIARQREELGIREP